MGVTNRVELGGIFAKEEAKYPWVAACDERACYFVVSAKTEKQGVESIEQHKCPYGGDERAYKNGIVQPGGNTFEAVWDMLDSATDGLMLHKARIEDASIDHMKALELKGRAGGLASVIMFISTPYFDTVQDVSRWALERYKMRTGQRDFEPTVGCEGYDPLRGEPSPQWVTKVAELRRMPENQRKPMRGAVVTPKPVPKPRVAEKELSPEETQGIKNALSMNMLDDKTIADMFKCSVAQVRSLKA